MCAPTVQFSLQQNEYRKIDSFWSFYHLWINCFEEESVTSFKLKLSLYWNGNSIYMNWSGYSWPYSYWYISGYHSLFFLLLYSIASLIDLASFKYVSLLLLEYQIIKCFYNFRKLKDVCKKDASKEPNLVFRVITIQRAKDKKKQS